MNERDSPGATFAFPMLPKTYFACHHRPIDVRSRGCSNHRVRGRGQACQEMTMATVATTDGTTIFYKDWGPKSAQPIVFHHGWPLSGDDWDTQMLFFLDKGYRVIAHDRRGHGRSSQVGEGHDMDHYAADVAAVVSHLELRNAVHIGHS